MSNQKIPFGRGKSGTLDDLKPPKIKHYIEKISQETIKQGGGLNQTKNTVGSEKLINDDFKRIKNGEAERVSIRGGKSTEFHINGRIYGVGCTGTMYPKEGKNLYCLSKKEAQELSKTPEQDRELSIQSKTKAKDLAKKLNMTTATLYEYVNGDGTPKEKAILLLENIEK